MVSYERVLSQNPQVNSWYMHIPFVGTSLNQLSHSRFWRMTWFMHTFGLVWIGGKKASEMWNMYKQFGHVQLNCGRPRLAVSKFHWFTLKKKKRLSHDFLYFFRSVWNSALCYKDGDRLSYHCSEKEAILESELQQPEEKK